MDFKEELKSNFDNWTEEPKTNSLKEYELILNETVFILNEVIYNISPGPMAISLKKDGEYLTIEFDNKDLFIFHYLPKIDAIEFKNEYEYTDDKTVLDLAAMILTVKIKEPKDLQNMILTITKNKKFKNYITFLLNNRSI